MDSGLEIRLIEKGIDVSTRRKMKVERAAKLVEGILKGPSENVILLEGKGSEIQVSTNGGVYAPVQEGPIFLENPDGNLQIYSANQLLLSREPVRVELLSPISTEFELMNNPNVIYAHMGKLPSYHTILRIQSDGLMRRLKRFPKHKAPSAQGLFPIIVKYLGLNPSELKSNSITVPDRGASNGPINLRFSEWSDGLNEKYSVDAVFQAGPRDAKTLKPAFEGIDVHSIEVTWSNQESRFIDSPSQLKGQVSDVRAYFQFGKAHQLYSYLERLLGKSRN